MVILLGGGGRDGGRGVMLYVKCEGLRLGAAGVRDGLIWACVYGEGYGGDALVGCFFL